MKDLISQSHLAVLASLNRNLDIRPLCVVAGLDRGCLTEVYQNSFNHFETNIDDQYEIHHSMEIPKGNHSLDYYGGAGSSSINNALWENFKNGNSLFGVEHHIKKLDSIMREESIHHSPFNLYTGLPKSPVSLAGSEWDQSRAHKLLYFPAYTSTSTDVTTATLFTKRDDESDHHESDHHGVIEKGARHVLQLHYPNGKIHSAASVMNHVGNNTEMEVLLGRGHEYVLNPRPTKVTNSEFHDPIYVWHATYGPRKPNPQKI